MTPSSFSKALSGMNSYKVWNSSEPKSNFNSHLQIVKSSKFLNCLSSEINFCSAFDKVSSNV